MSGNPIAFNPLVMEVRQLVDCAESLRMLFTMLDRDAEALLVKAYLMEARDHLARKWGVS